MWIYVMFDLPVITKKEKKEAAQFKNALLDLSFEMVQYSVYTRICGSTRKVEVVSKKIEHIFPHQGKVDILAITDKQHSDIICLRGEDKEPLPQKNQQFLLF